MSALAGKQWPRSALPPTFVRAAVRALSVTVVIVPSPARAVRGIHLEHLVDDAQRIFDQGVARFPDPIANQFKKPRVDHILCREFDDFARTAVANWQPSVIRVF